MARKTRLEVTVGAGGVDIVVKMPETSKLLSIVAIVYDGTDRSGARTTLFYPADLGEPNKKLATQLADLEAARLSKKGGAE